MDDRADTPQRNGRDSAKPEIMLQEAAYLNEEGLGHPLNFMSTLYYETTLEEPPREPGAGIGQSDSDSESSSSPSSLGGPILSNQ